MSCDEIIHAVSVLNASLMPHLQERYNVRMSDVLEDLDFSGHSSNVTLVNNPCFFKNLHRNSLSGEQMCANFHFSERSLTNGLR